MNTVHHPIRSTIIYGLICGLSFVPLTIMLNACISWSNAVGLAFWLFILGYSILLSRWSGRFQPSTVYPLLFLLPPILSIDAWAMFFMLALMAVSWIRSGICFPKPGLRRLLIELLLCLSGVVLMQVFRPGSLFSWALGVWMFFLVQALYFVFLRPAGDRLEETVEVDAFERASANAEGILARIRIP